jgi:hypothetical protein
MGGLVLLLTFSYGLLCVSFLDIFVLKKERTQLTTMQGNYPFAVIHNGCHFWGRGGGRL